MIAKVDTWMKKIERFLELTGAGACFVLMVFVVLQVLGRYVFKSEIIPGLYNIIESYVFPVIVFTVLGASYRAGLWPRLDIFILKMPKKQARIVNTICLIIEFILYLILAIFTLIYAVKMVAEGRQMQAGAFTMPLYPVLCIVPVAFSFLCVEILLKLSMVLKKDSIRP